MKQPDIDALARLLDGDLPEGEAPAEAHALGAFARTLEASAARPTFEPRAELRAALIAAARDQAAAPGFLTRLRSGFDDATARVRYSMRLAAATGASALALSSGGVALASQQALPGDALYGVKLALEDAGLLFIGDQVSRGQQQLVNAGERMDEAHAAATNGDMDGTVRALREADEAGRAGARDIIEASQRRGDPSLLDLLADFSGRQRARLTALLPLLDGEAEAAANDAIVALNRIDQRVAVLGGSCAECGTETVQTEESRQTAAAPPRDDVIDARDFDFADIPPASEPFTACPCVSATGPAAGRPRPAGETADEAEATEQAEEPAREPRDPEPTEEPADDEEDRPELPDPVEEPVDEVEDEVDGQVPDEVDDVIDDVLDELPTPDAPAPQQSGSSGLPGAVPLPTPSLPVLPSVPVP
jgi:hypothetical protein